MVTVNVAQYLNSEGDEVLLELCSGEVKLYAFCYPFAGKSTSDVDKVTLYGLFTHNIGPSSTWHPPCRTSETSFEHHIYAKIVNVKERLVSLGEIDIVLDSAIDSSFPTGSIVSFDVIRLDY